MTDETPKADGEPKFSFPQQLPGAQPAPTMNAGHILMAGGINEVSVMFGQTRLLAVTAPNNQNSAVNFIEWFATITLSPPVAQQLRDGLDLTLQHYTKQFGPIPKNAPPQIATTDTPPAPKKGKPSKYR
jgi:hypothetical protein